MIQLADAAVEIANAMLRSQGLPEQPADDTPISSFTRVLADLQRHYVALDT